MKRTVQQITLALAAMNLFVTPPAHGDVKLESFEEGSPLTESDLAQKVPATWTVLTGDQDGGTVRLWDLELQLSPDARVVAGSSSESIFFAVVKGKLVAQSTHASVKARSATAKAGKAIYSGHDAVSELKVSPYSLKMLHDSLDQAGRLDLAEGLEPLMKRQRRMLAWGLLRKTPTNVASPLKKGPENLRKSYLNQPEILTIRRDSQTTDELARKVMRLFLESLSRSDAATTAKLLSPQAFEDAVQVGKLVPARKSFAASLLQQPWTRQVRLNSVKPSELLPLTYEFTAGDMGFEVQLEPFDSTLFIKSILPLTH